ncbi:6331_t:CDS:1, partial [Racocetra fulgida]
DNLADKLNPLLTRINYETVKEKCKEALDEIQDFLTTIVVDINNLLDGD